MMIPDDPTPVVWQNRWIALEQYLMLLRDDVASQGEALSRSKVFTPLIDALHGFGQSHFNYFKGVFRPDGLNKSEKFPPEFVMRQVIIRIAEDAQVIQSCIDQRRHLRGKGQVNVLLDADKLAWAALRPAVDHNLLLPVTTAITYFQKVPSIRVIPYASVALVGIPITCLNNPVDYLAIPHEIGHYVFWNSGVVSDYKSGGSETPVKSNNIRTKLKADMKGSENWIQRWIQEIFADTYGALVAQGAIALSFQDLENESSKDEFTRDDSEHPSSIVRPYIYADVIEKSNPPLATNLRTRWEELLQKRRESLSLDAQGVPATLMVEAGSVNQNTKEFDDVKQNYMKVLGKIDAYLPLSDLSTQFVFPGRGENDPAKVYDIFTTGLDPFLTSISIDQIDTPIVTQSWEDWIKQFNIQLTDTDVKVATWQPVLKAEGWTTEGPISRDLD